MNPSRTFDIAFYAPAGCVQEPLSLPRAEAFLTDAGHRVHIDQDTSQRYQRFAGDDATRLAAVHRVLHDSHAEIALAVRGGYGWTRLLSQLDYAALAQDKKIWLGHSDFTAFQLAALAKAQRITFAGPMACYDFGAEAVSPFTVEHCFGLLSTNRYEITCPLREAGTLDAPGKPLHTQGTLWGSNLRLITHLVGTPFFPQIENGILFLEDVHEAPYQVERMLYQLHHSGVLARQRAVLLGHFTEAGAASRAADYSLDDAIAQLQRISGIPFYHGLPFGHVRDKITLPVGAPCELAIDTSGAASLTVWNYQS